jgi:hypothetical protein
MGLLGGGCRVDWSGGCWALGVWVIRGSLDVCRGLVRHLGVQVRVPEVVLVAVVAAGMCMVWDWERASIFLFMGIISMNMGRIASIEI